MQIDEKTTHNVITEVSAMAVVFCNDMILTTNEDIYGKEVLSLPKGHVESNETTLEASIRECYEETNVKINKTDLVKDLTSFSYEFLRPSGELIRKTLMPFLFKISDFGNPLPKEKRMISVQWMPADEFISQCSYQSVKNVVDEALKCHF